MRIDPRSLYVCHLPLLWLPTLWTPLPSWPPRPSFLSQQMDTGLTHTASEACNPLCTVPCQLVWEPHCGKERRQWELWFSRSAAFLHSRCAVWPFSSFFTASIEENNGARRTLSTKPLLFITLAHKATLKLFTVCEAEWLNLQDRNYINCHLWTCMFSCLNSGIHRSKSVLLLTTCHTFTRCSVLIKVKTH